MSGDEEIDVKIANVPLRVPICKDRATTEALATAIGDRVREIEAQTKGRIDSTAFALRAAFEFASDLHVLREEQEATTQEIAVALDRLLTRLEATAGELESAQ